MNRRQLLSGVLKSPIHQTVSRRFMLLRAVDGQALSPALVVRYATHDGRHIVVGHPDEAWWRGIGSPEADSHEATVRFKGREQTLPVELASGEELDEAVLRYLQKYPGEWTELGVAANATADDMEQAASGVAVVLFTAEP